MKKINVDHVYPSQIQSNVMYLQHLHSRVFLNHTMLHYLHDMYPLGTFVVQLTKKKLGFLMHINTTIYRRVIYLWIMLNIGWANCLTLDWNRIIHKILMEFQSI